MKSLILISLGFISASLHAADPLPSWNYGATKQSITAFVEKVTKEGSPDFIAVAERIATFDNDGTLWSEQPLYFQLFFAMDRIKTLAPQHPDWKDKEPFASLLKGDVKAALAGGEASLAQTVMATHAGLTTGEFEKIVPFSTSPARKRPVPAYGPAMRERWLSRKPWLPPRPISAMIMTTTMLTSADAFAVPCPSLPTS